MEADTATKALRRPNLRALTIWAVMVLMLMGSLAVMPDEAEAQAPGNKDITFYLHNVTAGAQIPARSLVMGVPGKVVRTLTASDEAFHRALADKYTRLSHNYRNG